MLRFAANIGAGHIKRLFSEYPFLERFDRAAAADFEAVEFPEPYGEDVRAIRAALTRNGLRQVQFNLPINQRCKLSVVFCRWTKL
jgi:hydroxypyruvate isomerase